MTFDLSRSKIKNNYFNTFASSYNAEIFMVEYRIVVLRYPKEKFSGTIILFEKNYI